MIRPYEDRDAEAAAAMISVNDPWLWTAAGLRHRLASLPERAHRATWVAEVDGELVGWAEAEFDWTAARTDVGRIWAIVEPTHRCRGYGSALFDRAVEHVTASGATELRSFSFPEGDSFLERRAFERARVERVSALDPRLTDTSRLESLPPGVRVVALVQLQNRLPEVFALFTEALADTPADHPSQQFSYYEFLDETIGDPTLSHEGSSIVLVDGRPVALSFVCVDPERGFAEHHLTGTLRSHRRRGLARLAKLAVIRWCAEAGVVRLATGNDSTNTGMLALNDQLGFRPFAAERQWLKKL